MPTPTPTPMPTSMPMHVCRLDSEDEETCYKGDTVLRTPLQEAARNDDFSLRFALAESRAAATSNKFKVVAPWRSSCVPPTRPPPQDQRRPHDRVALEWVNGCSAKNMRQAVKCVCVPSLASLLGVCCCCW